MFQDLPRSPLQVESEIPPTNVQDIVSMLVSEQEFIRNTLTKCKFFHIKFVNAFDSLK